jgi:hypothetical protein
MTFLFESLDFLSTASKIYIYDNERYKTKFGAFTTILTSILIFSFSCFFFVSYYLKNEMNVLYYRANPDANTIPYIDMNHKLLMFRYRDINFNLIDPRIATIKATFWDTVKGNRTVYELNLEPCSFEKHLNTSVYRKIINFDISTYSCIQPGTHNLFLTSQNSINTNSFINLYILECQNSTLNKNFCFPKQEISAALQNLNMFFDYYMSSFTIDHYNYKNPITETPNYKRFKITYDFYYFYYEVVKLFNYNSDYGSVFDDIKTFHGYEYDENNS